MLSLCFTGASDLVSEYEFFEPESARILGEDARGDGDAALGLPREARGCRGDAGRIGGDTERAEGGDG